MKLRNKKTGEIVGLLEIVRIDNVSNEFYLRLSDNEGRTFKVGFNSLAKLNEEWEDYEEPEMFYIVEQRGMVGSRFRSGDEYEKMFKEIGNYFETKEEAEKAVEKLKALTEAKEDGLKIKGYYYNHEDLVILADIGKCNKLTLDTLFGKEID